MPFQKNSSVSADVITVNRGFRLNKISEFYGEIAVRSSFRNEFKIIEKKKTR
jgi:hypothetical protein